MSADLQRDLTRARQLIDHALGKEDATRVYLGNRERLALRRLLLLLLDLFEQVA